MKHFHVSMWERGFGKERQNLEGDWTNICVCRIQVDRSDLLLPVEPGANSSGATLAAHHNAPRFLTKLFSKLMGNKTKMCSPRRKAFTGCLWYSFNVKTVQF